MVFSLPTIEQGSLRFLLYALGGSRQSGACVGRVSYEPHLWGLGR